MSKVAFITGITGQDGAYLAQFLLSKDYTVYGAYRRTSSLNFWRLQELDVENHPNLIVKSTSGYLEKTSNEEGNCVLKIVMPFDTPPPAISDEYLCTWKDSSQIDSLCYTTFECSNIDVMNRLGIAAPCLFLVGYVVLISLMIVSHKIKSATYVRVSILGSSLILAGFIIAKITPQITDYLLTDVFKKIREVTLFKGGVNYLDFETIRYVLGSRSSAARTLMDILAGLSAGFIMLLVDVYRRTFG
jgi:hypothetical protein